MPDFKTLSILLVNYNSERTLAGCLASVYDKITDVDFEVVVVNNDSKEDLGLIRSRFPEVRIIDHRRNVGFGAGHNLGARSARGEMLLLLNPDARLAASGVRMVLDKFAQDEGIGAIGGGIMGPDGLFQEWSAGFEISLTDLLRNNLGLSRSRKIWKEGKTREVQWVAGTALFIRRSFFENLGGFDEDFFMYFEDMDLCRRIRQSGRKVLYLADFPVRHESGTSYKDQPDIQKKHYYASQKVYFKKHYGWLQNKLFRLAGMILSK